MSLSRRAFLRLAALGAASLAVTGKPSQIHLPTFNPNPLRLRTTGRPKLEAVIAAFTQATGRTVEVSETDTLDFVGVDLAIVPAHALTHLIAAGAVQRLEGVPSSETQRPYDPANTFSLIAGRGAIGINARGVNVPTTWGDFFERAATTPSHLPSAQIFYAALKHLGGSVNTRNWAAHVQARALVSGLTSVPLAQAQLALGPQLAGWQFVIPEAGAELWEDCYCLPVTSAQPALAQTFLQLASQQALPMLPVGVPLEPRSPFAPAF